MKIHIPLVHFSLFFHKSMETEIHQVIHKIANQKEEVPLLRVSLTP